MIKYFYQTFLKKIRERNRIPGKSFFDYPSVEKKKIVKNAVREANKMQLKLLKEFEKATYL